MKKLFLFLLLILTVQAHDIEIIEPLTKRADLGGVQIDSGFYGEPPGNIKLNVVAYGPAVIRAYLDDNLTSEENFYLPEGGVQWQLYWADKSTGFEILNGGASSWVPYRRGGAPLINITQAGSYQFQLGTTIRRVPSVQPNGRYRTKVTFEIDDF
jgi:hypothetical protein